MTLKHHMRLGSVLTLAIDTLLPDVDRPCPAQLGWGMGLVVVKTGEDQSLD